MVKNTPCYQNQLSVILQGSLLMHLLILEAIHVFKASDILVSHGVQVWSFQQSLVSIKMNF